MGAISSHPPPLAPLPPHYTLKVLRKSVESKQIWSICMAVAPLKWCMKAGVGAEIAEQPPAEGVEEGVGAYRASILEPILGPSFPTVNALGPKGNRKMIALRRHQFGTQIKTHF